ncbi:DUF4395 domain-containing protein [Plantactinospora sonchi]|uniref:DUF4395 domain-containing protein n=1 Tax=Plantactinospora sonchi TaxID=1544735 RepID=A0ABU7S0X7_9ACTN
MLLDPRAPRFAAALTALVMVVVLLTGSGWLALAQAAVFGVAAVDPRWNPYALIFRFLVAPRLARPTELEPAAPVRFSQVVGLLFLLVGAAGYLAGAQVLGLVMSCLALAAAFLNAAFGLCLGCETYLAFRRLTGRPVPARVANPAP